MREINFEYEVVPFCCETSLMNSVLDTLGYIHKQKLENKDSDNYSAVSILCQCDLAEAILKHMCVVAAVEDIDLLIDYIDFDTVDYQDEFGVVLYIEEDQLCFSIEKAKCSDGRYKLFDMDYVYISNECSPELILKQDTNEVDMDVFSIGEDCEK